jgi:proteasome activator subunit 3 (PA28 gamma)
MAVDSKRKVDDYKSKVKKEGEQLVAEVFPQRVVDLNELLESERFSLIQLKSMKTEVNIPVPDPIHINHIGEHDGPPTKRRKADGVISDLEVSGTKVLMLTSGMVPTNKQLVEMIDLVKPFVQDLIDHANKVKMWIAYLIPRIEDGNNFGVSIQEDTMAEARQVETEAATYLDQISRYFITRGKIISKVAKYPHVEDYRRTVQELDEKEFISLRLVVIELRNHYASLHDLITKNLDKIKKPRSSNADNMY